MSLLTCAYRADEALPAGLDAELRLALRNDWQDHCVPAMAQVRVFLHRRDTETQWPEHRTLWSVGDYATAIFGAADSASLAALGEDFDIALAEPIAPSRRTRPAAVAVDRKPKGASRGDGGDTLLGMVDDGCPFAHAALRRAGVQGTRVVALWDQNAKPTPQSLPDRLKYGQEWGQSDLDALMSQHRRGTSVDEAACYRAVGLDALEHRWTHGAHVAGRLAGNTVWSATATPGPSGAAEAIDAAASADLAFVQLPTDALLTVSPAAIAFHVFNGIAYLIQLAKDLGYKRLVVAVAYESWLGPHDGTSWFERALDELIAKSNIKENFPVRVVLAAGNGARKAGHLGFLSSGASRRSSEPAPPPHFYLAPDSELPTWVELWLPQEWIEARMALTVTSPEPMQLTGSAPLDADGAWVSNCGEPLLSVYGANGASNGQHRVLLRFAATRAQSGQARAPHGVWQLRFEPAGEPVRSRRKANAYVNRAGRLMYETVLTRQSRFVLPQVADQRRTLSGLAGGLNVVVAGSAYPKRLAYNGPLSKRFGAPDELVGPNLDTGYSGQPSHCARSRVVDARVPTEDGLLLPGQIGLSTRSGGVWRMSGTSVAVPTVARWLADSAPWPAKAGVISTASPANWPMPAVREDPPPERACLPTAVSHRVSLR